MNSNLVIFMLVILAGSSFASCIEDAFVKSCQECAFDSSGKMDEECRKSHEESGKTCLLTRYPVLTYIYASNSCPEVGSCQLQANICRDVHSTGSDEGDCMNADVKKCFEAADTCVATAVNHCDSKTNPCSAWVILSGLIGAAVFFHRGDGEGL